MFTFKDYIYEIEKEKSFTIAAQKLFLSQPALSICVKKTEEKLGAEIFDRKSLPVRLTECGKAYINAVEQIYAIENDLKNKISDIGKLNIGSLSVCGANVTFTCVLPKILEAFLHSYPNIELTLSESFSEDLKNKVARGLIDLIIDYDFDNNLFTSYPVKEEKILLCVSRGAEIAKKYKHLVVTREEIVAGKLEEKKGVDITVFKNEQFILLKKKNDMQRRASKIFLEKEMRPNVKIELDQLKTCYELSCKGLGVTFVTDTLIKNAWNEEGVYFKIASDYARREMRIAHKKNMYISNSMKKFIEITLDLFGKNK